MKKINILGIEVSCTKDEWEFYVNGRRHHSKIQGKLDSMLRIALWSICKEMNWPVLWEGKSTLIQNIKKNDC